MLGGRVREGSGQGGIQHAIRALSISSEQDAEEDRLLLCRSLSLSLSLSLLSYVSLLPLKRETPAYISRPLTPTSAFSVSSIFSCLQLVKTPDGDPSPAALAGVPPAAVLIAVAGEHTLRLRYEEVIGRYVGIAAAVVAAAAAVVVVAAAVVGGVLCS